MTKRELIPIDEFADLLGDAEPRKDIAPVDPDDYIERYAVGRQTKPTGKIRVRKQASKSGVMQQRLALEAGIRDYISHPKRLKIMRDALDRLFRIAAYGLEDKDSVAAGRVLFEKVMSSAKQEEEASRDAPPQVTIVIENATIRPGSEPKVIEATVIDPTKETK
jgi:hypothetical protein